MTNRPIADADIEKVLDFLRDSAKAHATAKANRVLLEEQRKSVKAVLMKHHADLPIGAQEREAYAAPEYAAHLVKMADAVLAEEELRGLRVAAEAKIEAWRTMNANYRSMKL